jgi:hypothetical protein
MIGAGMDSRPGEAPSRTRARLAVMVALVGLLVVASSQGAAADALPAPTPGLPCDAGSMPETGLQGDIPQSDMDSGRFKLGYWCNARLVSDVLAGGTQLGAGGGYRVERYADHAGNVCAYFDSGTLFPNTIHPQGAGVWVLDMHDPANPVHTATLSTPAMLTPHESLRLNQKRGLLVADQGNPAWEPGVLDVYDVSQDCRHPVLDSEIPDGLGHEGGFAPDGRTYYVRSTFNYMAAVDVTNPKLPQLIWTSTNWRPHGVSISNDGDSLFMASYGTNGEPAGLAILDVSQVQHRVPNPQVTEVSHLTWPELSIPQNATPFESRGHQYLVETDEFGGGSATSPVGAARIINIDDLRNPFVVSHLRLAVDNLNDSGKTTHYCTVPSRVDPYIIACAFLFSGLRVFDVRDVAHPVEVAYTNFTQFQETWIHELSGGQFDTQAGGVYSAPAYDPVNNDIWYSDGTRGFFAIHLTAGSGIKQFARRYLLPGS